MPDQIHLPEGLAEMLEEVRQLGIPNLEVLQPPFESLLSYYSHYTDIVPPNLPDPEKHVKIADYLIDAPSIAVNLSENAKHFGQIIGYFGGAYWVIADSIEEFVERLKQEQDGALYGR